MRRFVFFMKKRWMAVIGLSFVICLFPFSEANSQVRFGLQGGFQMASLNFEHGSMDESNRIGFSLGPTIKIGLPITGLEVHAAALYDQRELKVDTNTFKQQSLVLQGDARLGVGLGDMLGIFLLAGPQFSFNVGDDVKQWFGSDGELKQFSIQETLLSVNFGLGVTFANHLEGAIRYNIPVSKTADFTWQQLGDQLAEQSWNHATTSTNVWSLSVCYYF